MGRDLIPHCVSCLVKVKAPWEDKERSRGLSIQGAGETSLVIWSKLSIPVAYGEHVALSLLASENLHAGDAGSRGHRAFPEGTGRQAGSSTEMTAWSLALGWVLRGRGEAELRRNGAQGALLTGLWARLNIMRMPQTVILQASAGECQSPGSPAGTGSYHC